MDLEWDIDRLYPIPGKRGNAFLAPLVEHQIYLLSGLTYMNVDNEYLERYCRTRAGITICKQTQPIHDRKTRHDCAGELINFGNSINTCKFVVLKIDEITFIPLKRENQYIAILEKPIEINVICGKTHTRNKLNTPSLLRSNNSCDVIYNDNHMKIGETKINVTYEIHLKEVNLSNTINLDILLMQLEKTPKIFSNINGYQNTLDQITDQVNSLTFSHRIKTMQHWGLTSLQIAGYVALGTLGIYVLNKLGIFECLSKCLPAKLCVHLLCCKAKNNQIINNINPIPGPSAPLNTYLRYQLLSLHQVKKSCLKHQDEYASTNQF